MKYFVIFLCFSLILGKSISPKSNILRHDPRILNGASAKPGQFPWTVGMYVFNTNEQTFFCVGSIISGDWILTAASCIEHAAGIFIVAGSVDLDTDAVFSVADSASLHEDYDSATLQNDIAVIRLFESLTFDEHVDAITLDDQELEGGVLTTVIGFDDNYHVAYANVTTIDNIDCQKIYGEEIIVSGMVCTVSNSGSSPCSGDAGAPLVVDADGDPVLVAVFSFLSSGSCSENPSGYTRVAYYRDWIREKTGI